MAYISGSNFVINEVSGFSGQSSLLASDCPRFDRCIDPKTASPFYPAKRRGRGVLILVNGHDAALVDSVCEPAAIAAAIERLVLSILENDDGRA
jgi:hypothetical protein